MKGLFFQVLIKISKFWKKEVYLNVNNHASINIYNEIKSFLESLNIYKDNINRIKQYAKMNINQIYSYFDYFINGQNTNWKIKNILINNYHWNFNHCGRDVIVEYIKKRRLILVWIF